LRDVEAVVFEWIETLLWKPALSTGAGNMELLEGKLKMTTNTPSCPHGCGFLRWVDDQYYCPKCGDEWPESVAKYMEDIATPGTALNTVINKIHGGRLK
jgi:ribosomal protein S27AE